MVVTPTYTFEEVIELIRKAEDRFTLAVLAEVLEDEKKRYCLFHLRIICFTIQLAKSMLP